MFRNIFAVLIFVFLFTGCSSKTREFSSIDELAQEIVTLVNKGDAIGLDSLCMSKDEFINEIHPETPEAQSLSGEEMFEYFIKVKRANAIMVKSRQ